MRKLYMIGNTHFDPVWLWKWDEAMASVRATFRAALDRMKENDKFIYSFATPPVFEWIRKTDPEMFEEIKARVAEGRWDLAEGWWLQPDCYGASGESYVRQGLYGQRYLMEHFGRYSDTVFNIDSFGHSPMLPQILKKSKISNYCFVRPEKHHIELKNPLFNWKSADGSAVTAYRAHKAYEYEWQNTVKELAPDIARCVGYAKSNPDMVELAVKYDCKKIQLFKPYFDKDMIDRAHKAGIRCNVFFADDPEEATRFLEMGIDTILTNDYNRVSQAVEKYRSQRI